MSFRDPQTNELYTPFIIETSAGCDRTVLAVLCEAYEEETLEEGPAPERPSALPFLVAVGQVGEVVRQHQHGFDQRERQAAHHHRGDVCWRHAKWQLPAYVVDGLQHLASLK